MKHTPHVFGHRHILDLDDFSRNEIEEVLKTTDSMKEVLSRDVKQAPTLRGKTVVNMFFEEQTEIRISFEMAAHALSANVIQVMPDHLSTVRGASLIDLAHSIRGISADVLVLHHPCAGVPYQILPHFEGSLVNAGDGAHAHPTEALIDLFTICETFDHIDKLNIVMVGDVLHSGVARSLLWGLTKMGAQVTLCAPPPLFGEWQHWQTIWSNLRLTHRLDEVIEGADVIKVLPLSPTHLETGGITSLHEYHLLFAMTDERLERASQHALVLPASSMDEWVGISTDVVSLFQSIIQDRAKNGVALRMALLYLLIQ